MGQNMNQLAKLIRGARERKDTECLKMQRGVIQNGMVMVGNKLYPYEVGTDMLVANHMSVYCQKLENENKMIIVGG